MLPISFLIASLNSPVYLAIPVKDEKIVDRFLDELDETLAALARQRERGGWFGLDYDFYCALGAKREADRRDGTRCIGVEFGPVKWRLFYQRIGNGLYVASKRAIIEDLAKKGPSPVGRGAGGAAG